MASSNTEITGDDRVKFGEWMQDRKLYLGPLTPLGWGILLVAIVMFMFMVSLEAWQFGVVLIVAALAVNLLFVVRWGNPLQARTIAERVTETIQGARRITRGDAKYSTGVFSNLPADSLTALPGALANVKEVHGTDGRGTPYTLLHYPNQKLLVAVFACAPDGNALQTQSTIDQDVSWYSWWVAQQSKDSSIAGAVVIADSALRSSEPLIQRIDGDLDPEAPEIARNAAMEAARRMPARYAESTDWAVVAYSIDSLATSIEEAQAEVAAKMPYQVDALRDAGGGAVIPATTDMLAKAARVAYDPHRATEYASDELRGIQNRMTVSQAGPEYFHDDGRRVILHDGVASMSALVMVPPQTEITEDTLNTLFAPADKLLRKRVAVIYRPLPPERTPQLVEQMRKDRRMAASARADATALDENSMTTAKRVAAQVTKGASLTRFGILVTVTFEANPRAYREATLKMKSLLDGTGLGWRFSEWDAGATWHVTMPFGILPWMFETLPDHISKALS